MVPALFAPWAAYLVQSAHTQSGEHVLDVACGTGIVARQVARSVGSHGIVVGLDRMPTMLRVARTVAARKGLPIAWCAGLAERLPFPAKSFDLVLCQFGLMLFADRQAALVEMHRVLRRSGRILLSVWQGLDKHPFYQTLHEVSLRHLGRSGVQDAFSLGNPDELRRLLTEAEFAQVEIESVSITVHFPNAEAFLTWEIDVDPTTAPTLQGLDTQARQAILAAVRHDMQAALHEAMEGDQLVIPFHAHVVHAS